MPEPTNTLPEHSESTSAAPTSALVRSESTTLAPTHGASSGLSRATLTAIVIAIALSSVGLFFASEKTPLSSIPFFLASLSFIWNAISTHRADSAKKIAIDTRNEAIQSRLSKDITLAAKDILEQCDLGLRCIDRKMAGRLNRTEILIKPQATIALAVAQTAEITDHTLGTDAAGFHLALTTLSRLESLLQDKLDAERCRRIQDDLHVIMAAMGRVLAQTLKDPKPL